MKNKTVDQAQIEMLEKWLVVPRWNRPSTEITMMMTNDCSSSDAQHT